MSTSIETKLASLSSLKHSAANDIIASTELSKTEKVQLLTDHELIPHASYIQRPLCNKYTDPNTGYSYDDHWMDTYYDVYADRGRLIKVADIIEYINDNREEMDDPIVVVIATDYSMARDERYRIEIKITIDQLIEDLCDWVLDTKQVGWVFDW